jgi:uncharacterized OsmC-like protein
LRITLVGEDSIRLEDSPGMMTVEAASAEQVMSPFHMLAAGLASCTFSVLHSWAQHAKLDPSPLSLDLSWTFAEEPHRVGAIKVVVRWPGLPAERKAAAGRAAALCAVHKTLEHPPAVALEIAS